MEGDQQKMREALENIAGYAETARCHTEDVHILSFLGEIEGWARSALSAPPRQCDVGTAEEQYQRYEKFCCNHYRIADDGSDDCLKCPFSQPVCKLSWAQTPYAAEEGAGE